MGDYLPTKKPPVKGFDHRGHRSKDVCCHVALFYNLNHRPLAWPSNLKPWYTYYIPNTYHTPNKGPYFKHHPSKEEEGKC